MHSELDPPITLGPIEPVRPGEDASRSVGRFGHRGAGRHGHVAVLAGELGIAAVVGAQGALELPNGATVEVGPVGGVVRLL